MEKQQNLGFGSSPMVIYSHKLDHKKVAFLLCTIGLQVSQIWLCHSFWTTTSGYIHSLTGYFAIGLTTLFNSILAIACYRLVLHPLAKYPGPIFAAVTDWYNIRGCLNGDRHIEFLKLHETYGPVVRFGPNRVSFNSATALRDIYGVHANTQKSQLYSAYSHFFKVPSSVTTIDRKSHAFRRRINGKALTTSSVKGLEQSIHSNCDIFLQSLVDKAIPQQWGTAKDMSKILSYLMSDIMGDVTFSKNWNMQLSEKNRHIIDILSFGACLINTAGHMPGLLKFKLDQIFLRKMMEGTHQFEALSKAQSDWRIAQSDDLSRKDLFKELLTAKDPETGNGLTAEELVAEAGVLIVAGTDTTTAAMTATIFYLLQYHRSLERVKNEIRSSFGSAEEVRIGTTLTSCKYLFACIDEAMRLSPGVGALLSRETLTGGLFVDGEMIPAGVDVGVSAYSLHRNPAYFSDPFQFLPERWLNETGLSEEETNLMHSAFTPFGYGRTSCVGKYLAYQELGIVIAKMVWLFDMRIEPGTHVGEGHPTLGPGRERAREFQTYEQFVSNHQGPLVQFRLRE